MPEAAFPIWDHFRARGVALDPSGGGGWVPRAFGDPLAEQRATRRGAGLYDFSFMAQFEVAGPDAPTLLARVQGRELSALAPGRLKYTLLLSADGSVHNDASVWRVGTAAFRIVTGRRSDVALLEERARGLDVRVRDRSGEQVVLALQGPASPAVLRRVGVAVLPAYFASLDAQIAGIPCTVARLGYTGEIGYEIFAPASTGADLWQLLEREGRADGLLACGFDAADALRIECGFVLFSRELAFPVRPAEIGLARLVERTVGPGGAALLRRAPRACLVGFVPIRGRDFGAEACSPGEGGWLPRAGEGILTSAAFSALYGRWIGMGYVHPSDRYAGTRVRVRGGGSARVVRLPIYDPLKRRPRARVA